MNNEPNISLYGDGSGEDFPVLKAFQQYIDAEQAKARRRLLTVSIVFVVTLIAVIAIFSMMVIKANNQTQSLNDRMVELLLKDKDRSIEEAKASAVQELTVKSLNETLAKLQQRIEEQDRKASAAAETAAKELAAAKAAAATAQVNAPDAKLDPRVRETEERIQKALALLKSEKQKLAEDKEKLRQEELERYRREHYPEYYAKREAAQKAAARAKSRTLLSMEEIEKELETDVSYEDSVELDDDDAIDYFDDADSYTIPVEVKGKRAGWRVPLD